MSTAGSVTLGQRIRMAREATRLPSGKRPTQLWLAEALGRAPQQVSAFETGSAPPDLPTLAGIYAAIRPYHGDEVALGSFSTWVAAWLALHHSGDPDAQRLLDDAAADLRRPAPRRRQGRGSTASDRPPSLTTLRDLPTDEPVTVILGDRRETKGMSMADCMILSGSMTDAMYLPDLGSVMPNFRVKSDKILIKMRNRLSSMPEIARSHLLVIGSPAANWGARLLNEHAIFPFRIKSHAVETTRELLKVGAMQSHDFASTFQRLSLLDPADRKKKQAEILAPRNDNKIRAASLVEHLLPATNAKDVMNEFRAQGFLDPADEKNHGVVIHPANDFAVVTMARNPWSSEGHRAIICAGVHGPGTAAALRALLTEPETFENRPLGGVLEVQLDVDLDWPSRFEQSTIDPQTATYEPSTVLDHLEAAVAATPDRRADVYQDWPEESLTATRDLVRDLLGGGTEGAQTPG